MTKYLEIGQIVNTFGIKGMVKVMPFTENIERFSKMKTVYVKNKKENKKYEIEEVKYHKNMVLIKFKGIENPEQADLLRQSYLLVDRADEEPLEEGTYYIVDMIGLEVYTEEGELLGILEDIFNTGSNDIYVVKNELGKQILLPSIPDVIKKIDMPNKKVIVHLLPGLV
ncbi:MAG: ribosome maturation factor RimM [Clostridia bacterium]